MALILASASPIRRAMLDAAGIPHEAVPTAVDEDAFKARVDDPEELALELAQAKALAIGARRDDWVIGSDSVVSVAGRRFGKPESREQAVDHLRFFSAKPMRLTSAVALAHDGAIDWKDRETCMLQVRTLSETFIDSYLDREWPAVSYCAGVFRMEGPGVQLFDKVEGSHFAILGMPLLPLLAALRERGIVQS